MRPVARKHQGPIGSQPPSKQTDPRHVEAYMRVEHPTLDGLSAERFRAEVAIECSALTAALEAARAERPEDVALVEVLAVLAGDDGGPVL